MRHVSVANLSVLKRFLPKKVEDCRPKNALQPFTVIFTFAARSNKAGKFSEDVELNGAKKVKKRKPNILLVTFKPLPSPPVQPERFSSLNFVN